MTALSVFELDDGLVFGRRSPMATRDADHIAAFDVFSQVG